MTNKTTLSQKPKSLLTLAGSLNLGGKEPPSRNELYDSYLKQKKALITNDKIGFSGIAELKVIDLLDAGEKNDLIKLPKIHSALKKARKLEA